MYKYLYELVLQVDRINILFRLPKKEKERKLSFSNVAD